MSCQVTSGRFTWPYWRRKVVSTVEFTRGLSFSTLTFSGILLGRKAWTRSTRVWVCHWHCEQIEWHVEEWRQLFLLEHRTVDQRQWMVRFRWEQRKIRLHSGDNVLEPLRFDRLNLRWSSHDCSSHCLERWFDRNPLDTVKHEHVDPHWDRPRNT